AHLLEGGEGDGREPELRPREGGGREEGESFPAEDLVADGLVEQVPARQALRATFPLVEDALGLEQERLPKPLGRDDDELVVAVPRQEAVDLGRAMEQRRVEVLRHADVIGVNGPPSPASSTP